MTWTGWAIVLCSLLAAGTNLAYVLRWRRQGPKWALRAFHVLAVAYFALLYTLLSTGALNLAEHGAALVRPGIGLLLLLLAAEPIADWKR